LVDTAVTPSHRGGSGSPLVCLHGFTATWRAWELVLPMLERHHEVLAPTLLGHAGGPPLDGERLDEAEVGDAVERAMDEAGFETAHIVGNSLGGYLALKLAERGRARSVVALAPAGGWAPGDESFRETLQYFVALKEQTAAAAPRAEEIASTPRGRRAVTRFITVNYEHLSPELVAHMMRGVADCSAVLPLVDLALRQGWPIEPERISCPVRIVWGTEDKLLSWPSSAARFRADWLPHADWVELEGVGHCPQLDVPLEAAQLILGFIAGLEAFGTRPARRVTRA
jgi:pimeloyl-ACP methyl ester carboxylesterase